MKAESTAGTCVSEKIGAKNRPDTKRVLADSLKELGSVTAFDKITIRNITDRAGLARVTFYNHFQDKYDLLAWIVREDVFAEGREILGTGDIMGAAVAVFTHLQENREFVMRAAKIRGQNDFRDICRQTIRDILSEYLKTMRMHHPQYPKLTRNSVASYYTESYLWVVMNWIEEGMPSTPQQASEAYKYISSRTMMGIIQDMQY